MIPFVVQPSWMLLFLFSLYLYLRRGAPSVSNIPRYPDGHRLHFACSLRTTLCVRFKSETVACGVITLASPSTEALLFIFRTTLTDPASLSVQPSDDSVRTLQVRDGCLRRHLRGRAPPAGAAPREPPLAGSVCREAGERRQSRARARAPLPTT